MDNRISARHSLRTRATVFTLAVFVLGISALSLYASYLLKTDMERSLGERQFHVVSVMADDINNSLTERVQGGQTLAKQITPALLNDPPALQAWLNQRAVLPFFNGGVWIAGADGVVVADVPLSAGRVGLSYRDRAAVASALRDGQPVISGPVMGKKRQLPMIGLVVPIKNAQGRVIGVISGVTDLDQPNFFDKIAQSRYGQSGGYLLIAPQHGLIVTASDKSRSMQPLPAPGLNAMHDRYMQGFEGYGVAVNSRGVQELSAAKAIPVAGWFVVGVMPTDEAFAPVSAMQHNVLLAALLLTLLTGVLTWWILKRQLSPLLETAQAMRDLATAQNPQPLPPRQPDEMGLLVTSFNQLLRRHQQREASLQASEAFKDTVLHAIDAAIAVVDAQGVIVAVNKHWEQSAIDNGPAPGQAVPHTGVGANYFSACQSSTPDALPNDLPNAPSKAPSNAENVRQGLQAVLAGQQASFHLDYACAPSAQTRWFSMRIVPMGRNGAAGAVITHTEITEQRRAQDQLTQMNRHLNTLIESIPDPIFFKDEAGRWLITNESAKRLYGLHHIDWQGKTEPQLCELQPEFTQAHHACLQTDNQAWSHGAMKVFDETVVNADGAAQHFEVRKIPLFDAHGERQSLLIIGRDITELKHAQESLRIAATAFEAQQGMVITDAQHTILQVNQAFTRITGYSAEEAVGQSPRMLASGRHARAFYDHMAQTLNSAQVWMGEIWNRRKNGDIYPQQLSVSAVKNPAGQTTHYVGIFSDISEQVQAQARIDQLSFYDPLTQLPNRRLLLERVEQALHASAHPTHKNALLFVDLDNFKTLNDSLGHQQGDLLLVQVAQRLLGCIREGDTVARLGSDEFVLLLEHLPESDTEAAAQAEQVGRQILRVFQTDFELASGQRHITPSVGITLFGGHSPDRAAPDDAGAQEPLKRAELAMFGAKSAGRNTLRFFEVQMQAEVTARAELEAELRCALTSQQLVLHYQPQVVGAGRITGAEALVRWQHPQRGMVAPAQFIPLAETSGLILPLGQWVLHSACAQLAAWASDADLSALTLAVNVSADQIRQADFVDTVLAALARTGAKPQRLKLELTESMLVDDVEAIIAKMEALKVRGVAFSLDDFGTGYSSLAYLKRLPLNQLKIDQGFVRNIVTDPNDAAIARMVVGLAESMGLAVIAEGVELQAQADFLAHLGCHAYQGYLFGRPLPLAELQALVRQANLSGR